MQYFCHPFNIPSIFRASISVLNNTYNLLFLFGLHFENIIEEENIDTYDFFNMIYWINADNFFILDLKLYWSCEYLAACISVKEYVFINKYHFSSSSSVALSDLLSKVYKTTLICLDYNILYFGRITVNKYTVYFLQRQYLLMESRSTMAYKVESKNSHLFLC